MLNELDVVVEDAVVSGEDDIEYNSTAATLSGVLRVREERKTFLGNGPYTHVSLYAPPCYQDLLAWSLERYRASHGWEQIAAMSHVGLAPEYTSVSVGPSHCEEYLGNGIVLLARRSERLVLTLNMPTENESALVVTCTKQSERVAREFVDGVNRVVHEENFYRGGKIEYGGGCIRFLELSTKGWDDLVLAPGVKEEVIAHSVGFLNRAGKLVQCGIASHRGILLTGCPGTGKTLICKALMNNSPGITCVTARSQSLQHPDYILSLYNLAKDLSPAIVFLEDIDLVGQDRVESGYTRGGALGQLLCALDGLEECGNVVTVATTNRLDVLDEALKDRPSRFDRVIAVSYPAPEQRTALLDRFATRIPIPTSARRRIAERSEGMTPAQIQEVVHSVVIESGVDPSDSPDWQAVFSPEVIDQALAKIHRKPDRLGFDTRSESAVVNSDAIHGTTM